MPLASCRAVRMPTWRRHFRHGCAIRKLNVLRVRASHRRPEGSRFRVGHTRDSSCGIVCAAPTISSVLHAGPNAPRRRPSKPSTPLLALGPVILSLRPAFVYAEFVQEQSSLTLPRKCPRRRRRHSPPSRARQNLRLSELGLFRPHRRLGVLRRHCRRRRRLQISPSCIEMCR